MAVPTAVAADRRAPTAAAMAAVGLEAAAAHQVKAKARAAWVALPAKVAAKVAV